MGKQNSVEKFPTVLKKIAASPQGVFFDSHCRGGSDQLLLTLAYCRPIWPALLSVYCVNILTFRVNKMIMMSTMILQNYKQ